jgi:DNA polymerase
MKPPACQGCEFESRGQGYVPGHGPSHASLALIGQGPGRDEVASGKPFVGPAGRRLDMWLTKAGIPRQLCWVDNSVRCWIKVRGKDEAPTRAIEECYQRHWGSPLREQVEGGAWVIAVGTAASKFLVGEWCGERAAGSLVEIELPTLPSV